MVAATRLFAERGFHGTGIRDIASAADLTVSALYHYIENKDDLLVAIMLATITPLRDAAISISDNVGDPAAALATLVEHHVWAHASDPLATIVADAELRALPESRREQIVALRDAYEAQWLSLVENGVDAGRFSAPYPRVAAKALLQMATGVAHWYSPKGLLDLAELCRTYADGALAFLRTRNAGGGPIARCDLDLPAADFYIGEGTPAHSGRS